MKNLATLLLPLLFTGCAALTPFEKADKSGYPCAEQLETATHQMVGLNFKLALKIKLMATNEVLCDSGMANIAVVVYGSPNDGWYFFPAPYYTITHIHFSPKHGKYEEYEEVWVELKKENDWLEDWCLFFIRWYAPKDWHKQGCGFFGDINSGHEIKSREHS